jgi:hypothetical protein
MAMSPSLQGPAHSHTLSLTRSHTHARTRDAAMAHACGTWGEVVPMLAATGICETSTFQHAQDQVALDGRLGFRI